MSNGGFIIPDNALFKLLRTELVGNRFFSLDGYSFIHLGVGMFLALFLDSPLKVLAILVSFEVIEIAITGVVIQPESFVNIVWDVLFGMLGFFIIKFVAG